MTRHSGHGRLHPAVNMYLGECRRGQISRREFLTRATAMGATASAAFGLLGATGPAMAQDQIQPGGDLRMQMQIFPFKDPRSYDFSQFANVQRGVIEYLVEFNNDGTFRGMLLEGWEVSDDGTEYVLRVRPGVTWNNGDPFTATDVARNIERWCEADFPANSMASRMAVLIDAATGRAIDGAIEVVDDLTVRLTLPRPDITLVAGMADYPAMIVHDSFDVARGKDNVGTGPFLMDSHAVGVSARIVRNRDHVWWGTEVYGGPYLDSLEFIDYGTDPAAWLEALSSGEIDMVYDSVGAYVDVMDGMGFARSEAISANTIVIRAKQTAVIDGKTPYADKRVRLALAKAVDNAICLELGYGDRGELARNDHIGPMHPEYTDLPMDPPDPAGALALLKEAGMETFEHELISIDDDWRRNTADAVAALLNDAGIRVKRSIKPSATFGDNWTAYPFSSTNWNGRPLGVQVWALAYRSGAAWNEFGFANATFDALLDEALALADHERRREVAAKMQAILRDEGVAIQPFWRRVYRHMRAGIAGAERHVTDEVHAYKIGLTG